MNVKCRDRINIHSKPKVFFVSHHEDFDTYFDILSNEIQALENCAIYYYENPNAISRQTWESDLSNANLIVIPITNKFLSVENTALEIYYFAQNMGIPVLAIMVERGLAQLFNDICGQKQFLDRTDQDPTSIPYPKKLKDYLAATLIGDEDAQRVRAAFDAYVFLSYRKKDRSHAHKLMRAVHENDFARDVAIWYDEFLQPDENFNESIKAALAKSELFMLAVTPNLVNEDNYIIKEEYPAAREAAKRVLPVELAETDASLLKKIFPDIPKCVSIDNKELLTTELQDALVHVVKHSGTSNPEHNYRIGLAYLHGIDVEINRERGVALIASSAEQGVMEAISMLVNTYYHGYFTDRDYPKAIYWQKKLAEVLQEQYDRNPSSELAFDLADALRFLTEIRRNSTTDNQDIDEMIRCCEKALVLCDETEISCEQAASRLIESKLETFRSLAILYELSEDYDKAQSAYRSALRLREQIAVIDNISGNSLDKVLNKHHLAQLHHDLGILYSKRGDFRSAVSELMNAAEIYQDVAKDTPDFRLNEAAVSEQLSTAAAAFDFSLAEKHSLHAVEIMETLMKENAALYELYYANAVLNRALVLSDLGSSDYAEISSLCLQAEEIYARHIDEGSSQTDFNHFIALYKLAGTTRKRNDLDDAGQYYHKAASAADKFLDIADSDSRLSIAHLFFDYGTFLTIDADKERCVKAVEYLRRALSLFECAGSMGQRYVSETHQVIAHLESAIRKMDDGSLARHEGTDKEARQAQWNFLHYLQKGDEAEKEGNYQKAFLCYQSARKHLSDMERAKGDVDVLTKADLIDRLALCCEMNQDLVNAEAYYKEAAQLALSEAKKTRDDKTIQISITYLEKVISFYSDFGRSEDATIYRRKLSKFKEEMLGVNENPNIVPQGETDNVEDGSDQVIYLPDRSGDVVPFAPLGMIEYRKNRFVLFYPKAKTTICIENIVIVQLVIKFGGRVKPKLVTKRSLHEELYKLFEEENKHRFLFSD